MKTATVVPKLTPTSTKLFHDLAYDAGNWNGCPLLGGNVGSSKELRGNVTQLKRAGLITTQVDDDDRSNVWVFFTQKGVALARAHWAIDLFYTLNPENRLAVDEQSQIMEREINNGGR